MRSMFAGLSAELGAETLLEEVPGPSGPDGSARPAGAHRRRVPAVRAIAVAAGLLLLSAAAAFAAAGAFSWTAPQQIDHQSPFATPFAIVSMSCSSTTLCVGNTSQGGELLSSTNPASASKSDWSVLSTSLIAQDGTGYSLAGTSCVTTGGGPFCVAAGSNYKVTSNQGVVLTTTNPTGGASAWTPTTFPVNLGAPSCSQKTTTTCIASEFGGEGARPGFYVSTNPSGGAGSWTKVEPSSLGGFLSGVTCASSTLCAAVDDVGDFSSSVTPATAASWSSASHTGQSIPTSLSCPTTSFCIANGTDQNGATEIATTTNPSSGAAATWTTAAESSLDPYQGISCSPDSSLSAPHAICLAHGASGGLEVSTDGGATWTAETLASGTGSLGSYSCPAHTLCVAGSSLGNVVHSANAFAGGSATWSAPLDVAGGISAVDISPQSCISTSLCVGSDGAGRILTTTDPANPSSWGETIVDAGHAIGALTCPSTSLCVATDSAGNVLESTNPSGGGAAWSGPATIDANNNLYLLQCPSSSLCVGVGNNDAVISTNPAGGSSTWSKHSLGTTGGINHLQCPSTSLCVATDGNVPADVIASTNPTAGAAATWSTPVNIDSSYINGLECPSSSLCVATDNNGAVLTSTNPAGGAASWSTPAQIDSGAFLAGLRCPSTSLCYAWDGSGNLLTSTNPAGGASTWSAPGALDPGHLITHIECATSSLCVAIDNTGNAFTTSNPAGGVSAWSGPTTIESGVPLHRVACPSASLCVIADSGGNVIAGTLLPPSTISPPTISGNLTQGQTLTETNGSWTNGPSGFVYQWQDCDGAGNNCAAIAGATGQSYALAASDLGHTIRVQETASNAGGPSSAVSSAPTGVVQAASVPPAPSNQSPPVVTGTTTVGQSLSASTGTWSGTPPLSYLYQWQRCAPGCSNIAGATGSSYTLTGAELGASVRVVVAATNAAGVGLGVSSQVGPVLPSAAQLRGSLAGQLVPGGKAARIGAILKAGGYKSTFNALTAGVVQIGWYLVPQGAHLTATKHKPKPVLVASGRVSFPKAGSGKLRLKLTGAGKRLLKHSRTLKLTAKGTFTPTGKTGVRATKTFKLKK